jgi:hypothetical protein
VLAAGALAAGALAACARASTPRAAALQPTSEDTAWSAGAGLPAPRDHHVTFVLDARGRQTLVAAGGMLGGMPRGQATAEVWGSAIGRDGAPGAWRVLAPLPEPRAGASVLVAAGAVVITSGITTGHRPLATTLVGRSDGAGGLAGWQVGPALPGARFHHASVHHRGHVYVLGGLDRGRASRTVFRAPLSTTGELGPWETLDSLPAPRSHHAAFVYGDAVYLVGGLAATPRDVDQVLRDVVRAPIGADGRVGRWETVSTMDASYVAAAAVVHRGRVLVVGGVENGVRYSDRVVVASLGRDGTIGPWSTLGGRLPAARAHVHQVPVVGGRLYSVAGIGAAPLADVFVSAPLPE